MQRPSRIKWQHLQFSRSHDNCATIYQICISNKKYNQINVSAHKHNRRGCSK